MFGIGTTELIVFLMIILIVVGPDKMPKLMRSIGRSLREVKKAGRDFRDAVGLDEIMRDSPPVNLQAPPRPAVEYRPEAGKPDGSESKIEPPMTDEGEA